MSEDDDAYVRAFRFRRFEGKRNGRLYRVMSIAWFNFRHAIAKSWFTKLILILIVMGLLMQALIMFISAQFYTIYYPESDINVLFRKYYAESILNMFSLINFILIEPSFYFFGLATMITGGGFSYILLISLVSGGLIADDKLHHFDEAYFSHVTRWEYLFGKLLSLMLFSFLLVMGPALMQFFILSSSLKIDFVQHLGLLAWALGFTFIATLILSLLALTISSLTTRRTIATLIFFMMLIMLSLFPAIFSSSLFQETPIFLIDLMLVIDMFGLILLGESQFKVSFRDFNLIDGVGIEYIDVMLVIYIVILFTIIVLYLQVIRRRQ